VRIKLHIYVTNMHYDIPTCCKDILWYIYIYIYIYIYVTNVVYVSRQN
jgi:hypothetical protein